MCEPNGQLHFEAVDSGIAANAAKASFLWHSAARWVCVELAGLAEAIAKTWTGTMWLCGDMWCAICRSCYWLTYIVINSLYGASVQVLEHARTIQLWILPPSEPARHCNQLVRSQTRITNPFWWLFVFGYIYSRYPRYQWFQYFSDQSDRCTSSHP